MLRTRFFQSGLQPHARSGDFFTEKGRTCVLIAWHPNEWGWGAALSSVN
jgi:hypothetical protein